MSQSDDFSMETGEPKQLIEYIFSEISTGNSRPFVDHLADDVRWTVMGTTKWSKTYEGKPAVFAGILQPLQEQLDGPYKATAHRFVAEGDLVVVEARGCAVTKTGAPYDNNYCFVYRVVDGKIREITEYMDTALVTAVLG